MNLNENETILIQLIAQGLFVLIIIYSWTVGLKRHIKAKREDTLYACFDGTRYPDELEYRVDRVMQQARAMRDRKIRQAGHLATSFWRTRYIT